MHHRPSQHFFAVKHCLRPHFVLQWILNSIKRFNYAARHVLPVQDVRVWCMSAHKAHHHNMMYYNT